MYHVEIVDLRGQLGALVLAQVDRLPGTVLDSLLQGTADVDTKTLVVHGRVDQRAAAVVTHKNVFVRLGHAVRPTHANANLGLGLELLKHVE